MRLSIIIPAHNEEKRIEKTLTSYCKFFGLLKKEKGIDTEFIIVLNDWKNKTKEIVKKIKKKQSTVKIIDLKESGKGLAVIEGFKAALKEKNDFIGFVDADMATYPQHFYQLIKNCETKDVIFASRYMRESKIIPKRPFLKTWGRELIFNPLVRTLMGIKFRDFQCGAKIFRPHVIKKIIPHITMKDWAFDVELLYLSQKHGFSLKEIPTIWYDRAGSKFDMMKAGSKMIGSIIKLRFKHSKIASLLCKK